MIGIILLVGVMIIIAGLSLLLKPNELLDFLRKNNNKPWLRIFAVAVRLLLGISLIVQCNESRWPFLMMIFGYIAIIAALFLAILTQRTFDRFMNWVLSWISPYARIGGVFAAGFGALLVFAFI